jgi:hypothetical protein
METEHRTPGDKEGFFKGVTPYLWAQQAAISSSQCSKHAVSDSGKICLYSNLYDVESFI